MGSTALAWGVVFATATALADEGPRIEGILIGTYQHAGRSNINGQDVDGEASGAIDLGISVPAGSGAFELEIKGGTTPSSHGVSSVLPEANASVGESIDADDGGRVIPWQLYYRHVVGRGELAVGLLDTAGWLDGNDVANDEFTQFLGATFVNNPTIDLPSASVGGAYTMGLGGGWGLTVLAANATGVEPRYRDAFEPSRENNGWFTAVQAEWNGANLSANAGVWFNSRHNDSDGDGIDDDRLSDTNGRGVYGNVSGELGTGQWNVRLGWADPDAQASAGFVGVAYARPVGTAVLGAAVGRTFASKQLTTDHADIDQREIYLRMPVGKGVTVTADLQHIRHSGFDPGQGGDWVTGVRVGWAF